MTTKEHDALKKAKTTVYMTDRKETLLNELFIKRLMEKRKTDKSVLLCEGTRLQPAVYRSELKERLING